MTSKRARQQLKRRLRQARQRAAQHDKPDNDPVIGYFAFEGLHVICDGDGCVIAGSKDAMLRILERIGRQATVRATTFSEILRGLRSGSADCFDEQASGRFLAPARHAGRPLEEQDFSDPGPTGMHFVRVQFCY